MPTQRIARYVMLYSDLARLAPSGTSASAQSYAVLEDALAVARKIAERCNGV
ncbi:hypothetical protein DL93DRAFT_2080091, partial [Clavulina sp. PMI_390]